MSETARFERRIEDLEVKVAYQDRLIEALDKVVQDYTTRIVRLEEALRRLSQATAAAGQDVGPADEKPPHY